MSGEKVLGDGGLGTEWASVRETGSRGDWQERRPEDLEPEGLSVHLEAISVSRSQTPRPPGTDC